MNPFLLPDCMWEGHDSCFMEGQTESQHGHTSVTSHISWAETLEIHCLSLLFQLLSNGVHLSVSMFLSSLGGNHNDPSLLRIDPPTSRPTPQPPVQGQGPIIVQTLWQSGGHRQPLQLSLSIWPRTVQERAALSLGQPHTGYPNHCIPHTHVQEHTT